MTNLQKVYYCFGECMCEVLQCPHQRKWQTIDSFASDFPDDLPRLALAVSNPELIVSWVRTQYYFLWALKIIYVNFNIIMI